jgi:thioredoxin 1
MVKQFDDANFQAEVIEASANMPVLVDFYAEWCGPCRMQGPIIEQLAQDFGPGAIIGKLDTDKASQTASHYGVRSIPTLMIFKDGKVVRQFVGMRQKEELDRELKGLVS